MLIDTCILIDHFRGKSPATYFLLNNIRKMKISSITDMEMSQGLRNKNELRVYEKLLQEHEIQTVDLNEEVSVKARLWVRAYGLSHNLHLADALIAATAGVYGLKLVTNNIKDFHFLDISLSEFH